MDSVISETLQTPQKFLKQTSWFLSIKSPKFATQSLILTVDHPIKTSVTHFYLSGNIKKRILNF